MRLGWVAAVAAVALGTLAVTAAPAMATTTAKSSVTIVSGEGSEFTGKVTSAKKRCRAGRTVKLYRETESSRAAYAVAGTTKSDPTGVWSIDGSFLAGFYYARVLPLLVHVNGMAVRCAGDYSMRQHF